MIENAVNKANDRMGIGHGIRLRIWVWEKKGLLDDSTM